MKDYQFIMLWILVRLIDRTSFHYIEVVLSSYVYNVLFHKGNKFTALRDLNLSPPI